MTLDNNAIQGNQREHHGQMTNAREERTSQWAGWPARFAIGIALLLVAWWVAAQNYGVLYNLLIAAGVWWGANQIKKQSDDPGAIWFWPQIVKGAAAAIVLSSILLLPVVQSALGGIERVAESTRPIYNTDTLEVQVMMNPVTGAPIRYLTPAECEARPQGICIDSNSGLRLEVFDPDESARLKAVARATAQEARLTRDRVATERNQQRVPTLLGPEHYLARGMCGTFRTVTIEPGELVGPIGAFSGQPVQYTFVGGSGTPIYATLGVEQLGQVPIPARKLRNGTFETQHTGPTGHMFFGAADGPVKVSLERTGCI
jgi:hypothetical protein